MVEDIHSIFADFEARLWAGLDARFKAQEEFVHERYRKTDAKLDRVIDGLADLTERVGALEQSVARVRREEAAMGETMALLSVRLDRIGVRLDRIAKRLDLTDEVRS